uniref:Toxin CptA n=1 Tax=Candidatus Kentrum sp. FM TaxID=2126340 RepID=A0A450SC48_9GAMM|nr:MAG: hypothetical protein BECKFM1743C_GA0114222_100766 [Candidatus Kentron sp. FM]VFJ55351.1 MAG: hypothetical protein BECKFM1743A_GA0114220_101476 [Candidatus Kentron sp. FM]VFK08626.1 MAG: hypothetical protein BECKFM1743B_GA0114221_100767 [Candidatus Kentron sp. FM]
MDKGSASKGNPQPIRLRLRQSRHLALLLLLAHVGAVPCLMAMEWAWPVKLFMGAAILSSLILTLREHAFRRSRSAIITLSWTEEGIWRFWTRDGRMIAISETESAGNLSPGGQGRNGPAKWGRRRRHRVRAYVHPYLVVLHLDGPERFGNFLTGKSIVLHPGMVDDADAFRRLRIRLRFL